MLTAGPSVDLEVGMAAIAGLTIAVAGSTLRGRQPITTVAVRRRNARAIVIASCPVAARFQGTFREPRGWCRGLRFQRPPGFLCRSFLTARLPFGCSWNYLDELVCAAAVRADDDEPLAAGSHVGCRINIHGLRRVNFDASRGRFLAGARL